LIFYGKIEKNQIRFDDIYLISKFLKKLENKDVKIEIKKIELTRSVKQNKYYWGTVIGMISEEYFGSRSEEDTMKVHEGFRKKFLNKTPLIIFDVELPQTYSTTELTISEFAEYVDKIRDYASQELNLYIPDPDPEWRNK
jgi:hypothetical protein